MSEHTNRPTPTRATAPGTTRQTTTAAPHANPQTVRINIGEIALHGFATLDRHAVAEQLSDALRELVAQRGPPSRLVQRGSSAQLNAGNITLPAGADARTIGRAIAQAMYREDGPQVPDR